MIKKRKFLIFETISLIRSNLRRFEHYWIYKTIRIFFPYFTMFTFNCTKVQLCIRCQNGNGQIDGVWILVHTFLKPQIGWNAIYFHLHQIRWKEWEREMETRKRKEKENYKKENASQFCCQPHYNLEKSYHYFQYKLTGSHKLYEKVQLRSATP